MESTVRPTPQLNYISSFFVNDTTLRNEEIEEVLFKNIANPVFKALHFLVDDEAALNRLHALTKDHPNAEKIKIAGIKPLLYSELTIRLIKCQKSSSWYEDEAPFRKPYKFTIAFENQS